MARRALRLKGIRLIIEENKYSESMWQNTLQLAIHVFHENFRSPYQHVVEYDSLAYRRLNLFNSQYWNMNFSNGDPALTMKPTPRASDAISELFIQMIQRSETFEPKTKDLLATILVFIQGKNLSSPVEKFVFNNLRFGLGDIPNDVYQVPNTLVADHIAAGLILGSLVVPEFPHRKNDGWLQ